jgi:histone acetyltransferase (RNA polymerase elongator complex component)
MFFGEWAHFAIGTPAMMEVFSQNSSDEAFKQNETHVRAITRTDCLAIYPTAFVRVTGVKTSL